ncbi:hypothetical protein PA598K_03247 [Paenibacillus sp. 598K]|uniref:hypothetical protein n=1 Tax=Paenibacillus sp. 598K TaxID=1117987 RepID=UPI000FF93765|nr:hypothetical protein [Paenibacillus sp. 598K]GBF74878.1 hypothetical protein PA598K_03247 [Paenibacillus sp. 598K]
MRKRRLHIMLVYCVVVVMVMIFIQSYSPTDIEVTHSAIAYPLDDKASAVITSISVHGKYYQQWFRKKRFEGQITVADWPYTEENNMMDLYVSWSSDEMHFGIATYERKAEFREDPISPVLVWFDDSFSQVNMQLIANEESYFAASGVDTLEQAAAIHQTMLAIMRSSSE